MKAKATRAQIVEIADTLFYQRGYDHTSFAGIAAEVGISRGNFYYHFKTKDEILTAVLERRTESTLAMLARWEDEGRTPQERILGFVQILIVNQSKIMAFGCPVGSLATELAKLDHRAKAEAAGIFTLFRSWLARQFRELGCGDAADSLALHLLGRSQGVAALATAYQDADFVKREVDEMEAWVKSQAGSAQKVQNVL